MRVGNSGNCTKIDGRKLIDGVIMLFCSMVLYNLGISTLLYLTPLLIFAARYGKRDGLVLIVLGLFLCFLWELVEYIPNEIKSSKSIFELALLMFIPMSLSAAGIMWMYTRRFGVVSRLFLSILPSLLIVLAYLVVLFVDRALFETLYAFYEDAFAVKLTPVIETLGIKVDMSWFFLLFLVTIGSLILPVILAAVCANCFIYETVLHSKESDWEDKVKGIEFSPNMVWGFIISFALILLFYFVSAPLVLEVVVVNIGLVFGVLYSVQGFAVLFSWLSRHMERLKSMSLFIVLFIFSTVVPGVNFIILLVLPLLGLLESFFDLKKIGEKDEDYS